MPAYYAIRFFTFHFVFVYLQLWSDNMIVAIFHIFGDQIFDLWVKMPSFLDLVEMRASAKSPVQRDSQNERKQICLGNYRPPGRADRFLYWLDWISLQEAPCDTISWPWWIDAPLENSKAMEAHMATGPATTLDWDEINRNDHRVQMEPMTDTGNVVVSVLAMNSNERLHLATGFNDRDQ